MARLGCAAAVRRIRAPPRAYNDFTPYPFETCRLRTKEPRRAARFVVLILLLCMASRASLRAGQGLPSARPPRWPEDFQVPTV